MPVLVGSVGVSMITMADSVWTREIIEDLLSIHLDPLRWLINIIYRATYNRHGMLGLI